MSLLPLRACGLALACSAVLTALSLCTFAPGASAEQVSYQQVTPVGPYDAALRVGTGISTLNDVTADGASVFFSTIGPFPGLPATGGREDIVRSSRAPDGTWSATWMSPGEGTFFESNSHGRLFEAASTDGTKVVYTSRDQLDPSRIDCGHKNEFNGGIAQDCYQRVYEYDSSTGHTSLISRAVSQPDALFDAMFASASPDLGTVAWFTPEAMTPGVADQNSSDVYITRSGSAALVSAPSGSTGSLSATPFVFTSKQASGEVISDNLGQPAGPGGETDVHQLPARNAGLVSADGSEVFFQDARQLTAGAPVTGVLENVYMRRGTTTTLLSSTAQRTLPTSAPPANAFLGAATPDGSSAFFETASQLTNGDENATVDVYRYDVSTGQVSLVSGVGATQSAAMAGTGSYFVTASADGSHVYFGSRDDLDPASAPPGEAWKLYERVGGRTRFIALVPEFANFLGENGKDETIIDSCAGIGKAFALTERSPAFGSGGCDTVATMRASADGSRLIFESAQALTPDAAGGLQCLTDNNANSEGASQTGGAPGTGCNIYSYDDATATITLLSPGASTNGAYLSRAPFPSLPSDGAITAPLDQPLLMSADGGRVFFSSKDALVPGAQSGLRNIYASSDGALTLVSPPNETSEAIYDGNSADGSQVFFHSRQSLIPGADNHGQFAIYDAQLGEPPPAGPSDPPPAPQPVASGPAQALTVNAATVATPAPVSVGAASATPPLTPAKSKSLTRAQKLTRALRACQRDRSKKRQAACKARARKRYGSPSKAKRSNRRGSR
jgi:hypothetical protein